MKNEQKHTHASSRAVSCSPAFMVASWLAVGIMAAIIFYMSAHTGNELDTSSGIITLVREWLAQAVLVLFSHPADISPIGHFCEYFFLVWRLLMHCAFIFLFEVHVFVPSCLQVLMASLTKYIRFLFHSAAAIRLTGWSIPLPLALPASYYMPLCIASNPNTIIIFRPIPIR